MLSMVGTLYAVLLGLVVVDAMVRFERAIDGVQGESTRLADVFLLAERFPEPQQERIQDLCRAYAAEVVEREWPLMSMGRSSLAARRIALKLTRSIDDFHKPMDIWGDAKGQLYVADQVPRLSLLAADGALIGRGRAVLNGAHGLCQAPDGTILLAEMNPRRLSRLVPVD